MVAEIQPYHHQGAQETGVTGWESERRNLDLASFHPSIVAGFWQLSSGLLKERLVFDPSSPRARSLSQAGSPESPGYAWIHVKEILL
jgi:hypothetical protein